MKTIKDYDRLVCTAVRNDPLGFIDILRKAIDETPDKNAYRVLREASCVIANLMDQLDITEKRGI